MAVLLDMPHKLVHDTQFSAELGVGITKCGYRFLLGSEDFKAESNFGDPPREGASPGWQMCSACKREPPQPTHKNRWKRWKADMRKTIQLFGKQPA